MHRVLAPLLALSFLLLPQAALADGEKPSDFTLPDVDGTNHSLSDYLGKKVILVNFWATWCAPCLKEMPKLQVMQNELGEQGLQVISISTDEAKDKAKVKVVTRRMKYTPLVLLDAETAVVNNYNPRKDMPWTMIIGLDGLIHHKKKGFTEGDEKKLRHWVEALLAKK